jgi:hypothetical protein
METKNKKDQVLSPGLFGVIKDMWGNSPVYVLNLFVPIVSTAILGYDLYISRSLPVLSGHITPLAIGLVIFITLLNIVFTFLTYTDITIGVIGLILINLIAIAIWHKHFIYFAWVGLNLTPIYWMVYRLWP